jgi:hypothetical protein
MFYDIYLYTLCYYICCLLGACMRCTRFCPFKTGCYNACLLYKSITRYVISNKKMV